MWSQAPVAHRDLLLHPAYTDSLCIISLNYVVSHPPRQLKISCVGFQYLMSLCSDSIFLYSLSKENLLLSHIPNIAREMVFLTSPLILVHPVPAEFPPPSLPYQTISSLSSLHILPLICFWASSLHYVWPAMSLLSSAYTFWTRISGFSPKFPLCFRADFQKQERNFKELHYPLQTLL